MIIQIDIPINIPIINNPKRPIAAFLALCIGMPWHSVPNWQAPCKWYMQNRA